MSKSNRNTIDLRPLCAFCLSPQFSIRPFFRLSRSSSRYRSMRCRRRDGCILPSVRPRFKSTNRHSTSILKNLTGVIANRGKILSLQEVLGIIQEVWRPSHHVESFSPAKMEESSRKSSNISTETSSPMLLRRRLSAPETIMRKHVLALERSESQDSEATHSSDSKCQGTGSDLNLSSRRDPNQMRKSTLLRRLWSNSRPSFTNSKFPGTFYEWQYGKLSTGKSTHSLTSIQSSPERLIRSQSKKSLNSSPQHKNSSRKISPNPVVDVKKQIGNNNNNNNVTSKRKISVYENYSTSFSDETAMSNCVNTTTSTATPKTETSTRSTNTSYTTFSENSDSAYTNSNYSNNNSTTPEIHQRIVEEAEIQNEDFNHTVKLRNQEKIETPQYIKYSSSVNESSTQTVEKTNVNVISNVQLSRSTLDLIYNQVMQDVQSSSPVSDPNQNQPESKVINVQQVPSFYLKPKDSVVDNPQHNRIVKYMISNVGTGSPYSKPAEVPQVVVPRFSALPRTASMEVNISSGDSTDKESDSVSLADSLEDSFLLRTELDKIREEKSGELPVLLPDNSAKKLTKPTAFFIPIEVKNPTEFRAVSDHLPERVRDKLAKRQQKREEKLQASKHSSPRSDSNYVSASDNGNQAHVAKSSDVNSNNRPRVNYSKGKKRKPLLPSIKTFRRMKVDNPEPKLARSVKRKSVSRESSLDVKNKQWVLRNGGEKLSPVYTSKSEYVYNDDGPKKFYHKTEYNDSNKRIEILEIMECIEPPDKRQVSRGKSKIPVLINKLPKMESRAIKPTFLDLNCAHMTDPKFDQLIANILIETLNSPNLDEKKSELKTSPKYQQKFDVIPEEVPVSNDEAHDSRNNNAPETGENSAYKGKAAVAVVRDENFASIPKGWITFYMLHKNRGSPDSTSDEGKKSDNAKSGKTNKEANNIENNNDKSHDIELRNNFKNDTNESSLVRNGNCETNYSSSSDIKTPLPHNLNARQRKHNQRKQKRDLGEWSVTVSGTNSYGQFAPDLEMCLKFPDKHVNGASQSDSGLGDDNEKRLQFPKIDNKFNRHNKLADDSEPPYLRQRLPDIEPNKLVRQQKSSGVPLGGAIPSRFEPRQTRTSLRRYNLSRPKIEYSPLPDSPRSNFNIFDERHYAEILKHFPEILTITGNAINSDRSKDPYN